MDNVLPNNRLLGPDGASSTTSTHPTLRPFQCHSSVNGLCEILAEECAVRVRALRITIVGMMAIVLGCGVALAALRDASDVWEGTMLMATACVLGAAILGSRSGQASDRAWWRGFALFGWGYLIATMAPWFAQEVGPKLPTSMMLNYLQRLAVGPPKSVTLTGNVSINGPSLSIEADNVTIAYPDGRTSTSNPKGDDVSLALGQTARTALPGAINREAFLRVGHCSVALFAAIIGALIARHLYSAEEAPLK